MPHDLVMGHFHAPLEAHTAPDKVVFIAHPDNHTLLNQVLKQDLGCFCLQPRQAEQLITRESAQMRVFLEIGRHLPLEFLQRSFERILVEDMTLEGTYDTVSLQ